MITNFEILEGYAVKLFDKAIEFKSGLNILFGPNGCGKSSILKIAAAYCSIDTDKGAGWTSHQPPFVMEKIPDCYSKFAPGKCKAKVEWDGTPTLLLGDNDQSKFMQFYYEKEDSPDGMMSFEEQIGIIKKCPSSGQMRISAVNKYIMSVLKPPRITQMPPQAKNYNDTWVNCYQKQIDYFSSLKSTGIVSLLMDEPDKSMSIENQLEFWTRMIPFLIKKDLQIIVATHCPFSLLHTGVNWIDFRENYREKSIESLKSLQTLF